MPPKMKKTKTQWKKQLDPAAFKVLIEKGTEMRYTGKYDKHYPADGIYHCIGCDAPLYEASEKFDSGTGWPSFFQPVPDVIARKSDSSTREQRVEVSCAECGGHLGHVFPDPGDRERHCLNSVCLIYDKDKEVVDEKAVPADIVETGKGTSKKRTGVKAPGKKVTKGKAASVTKASTKSTLKTNKRKPKEAAPNDARPVKRSRRLAKLEPE